MTTANGVTPEMVEAFLGQPVRKGIDDLYFQNGIRQSEIGRRLEAALSVSSGGLAVKAIQWSSEPPYRVARPFSGLHYATDVVWQENAKAFDYVMLSGQTVGTKRFASLSDAQAFAQADFNARILSALDRTTLPTAEGMAPAIREAVQLAVDFLKETKRGNGARSPSHNARLVLDAVLAAAPQGEKP